MRLTVLVLVKLSKVIGKPMTLYKIKVFKHCAELLFFSYFIRVKHTNETLLV